MNFCFSQKTYPQKIKIDSDTIVAISEKQMLDINLAFEKLRYEKELNDTLKNIIRQYRRATSTQGAEINSLQNQLTIKNIILSDKDTIISDYKKMYYTIEKRNKWIKIERNTFFVTTIILLSKVFLFK